MPLVKIRKLKDTEKYDNNTDRYVSCTKAMVLPLECYDWPQPDILFQAFHTGEEVLVDKIYSGMPGVVNEVDLNRGDFVDCLNHYLNSISMDDQTAMVLLKDKIYPYLDENYESLLRIYRSEGQQEKLDQMQIFLFQMSDGHYVRENGQKETVWMDHVPEGKLSFGRYRNLAAGSVRDEYEKHHWMWELHPVLSFEDALSAIETEDVAVTDWTQAQERICTALYYGKTHLVHISFLRNCVLSEEYDPEENLFRDAFLHTENTDILSHIIDRNDMERIRHDIGAQKELSLETLAESIRAMGLREKRDFFEKERGGLHLFNQSTLAMLRTCCTNRASADSVLAAIEEAAALCEGEIILHYKDISDCSPAMFACFFARNVVDINRRKKIAECFLQDYTPVESDDYYEACIRAIDLQGKITDRMSFHVELSLHQISTRHLGPSLQRCMLNNKGILHLSIVPDQELHHYTDEAISKALEWLDDEKTSRASYQYYTADLRDAFNDSANPLSRFLFDGEKVLLDIDDPSGCMGSFTKQRYKGRDAQLGALLQIILEQNELKSPWKESKREYINKLGKFRNYTLKQQKILFPDYIEHLNDATGNPIELIIPELLQNINDAKPGENQHSRMLDVVMDVTGGSMRLCYDEVGFSFKDLILPTWEVEHKFAISS